MFSDIKIIEIFCALDDFSKEYQHAIDKSSISEDSKKKKHKRKRKMSDSEVMTILILFHLKFYRSLKNFYLDYVCKHMRDLFPDSVSYNRFVELQKGVTKPLAIFLKMNRLGDYIGITFIDSTPLKVCHYKREKQHKVLKNIAEKSFGTLGCYYGFKLHLMCNDRGKIIDFLITKANVGDRQPLKARNFHDNIL